MDLIEIFKPLVFLLIIMGSQVYGCPAECRCYSMTVECGSLSLQEIPAGIPNSTQTVFLQDNAIMQIRQQDVPFLSHLQYLYIQNNSIVTIEPGAFRNQHGLLELALNRNRIHIISNSVFQGLEHLKVLYLSGNQITKLTDFTFCKLQRLQELHLQENSIELMEQQVMAGLSSLALLDLSRNNLHTISQAVLKPLISLQVLRLTENVWRCDCALHWLRTWINEDGQRLLSSVDKKIICTEPPRLAHQSLLNVSTNSLICIPPVVQIDHTEVTARMGDDLRVSCQASGYPQPLVTWRKLVQIRVAPSKVNSRPRNSALFDLGERNIEEQFDSDMGSGMLFLTNITAAHAGKYECEATNPGGTARVMFHLMVNLSNHLSHSHPSAGISQEPLYDMDSMDFNALGMATQTAIAIGISLLALTALLLIAVIYRKHRKRKKAKKEENILYVNDYSDGPTTFAQLEEYRDEMGHEMFVIDRSKTVFATYKDSSVIGSLLGLPLPEQLQDMSTQTVEDEAEPEDADDEEEEEQEPAKEGEDMFMNQGLLFQSQIAYEIHC
ncbi:leucine-rich repeat-containing protein 24 [Protopterus annectens]|uniref:leucine-rich repeat-containing protein 24 n=1 Tax=Protopterus annectens TaxID=7888 RepID=UPI001CF973DB|nr:leucine-rich repeat-containing protein 24 [Protopterus annectens]